MGVAAAMGGLAAVGIGCAGHPNGALGWDRAVRSGRRLWVGGEWVAGGLALAE